MPDGSHLRLPALPVAVIGAVIGAGPVGLAAAAHLLERGLTPLVLEAGPDVAHAVRAWGHVRMFTPWSLNVDKAARALLDAHGWTPPDAGLYPTGTELADRYLVPLARALGGGHRQLAWAGTRSPRGAGGGAMTMRRAAPPRSPRPTS